MPLAYSFCRHVVSSGAPLVVEDTRRHPLVRSNPAIRELSWISYAGVPLTTGGGQTAGALCVIDALPRVWSPRDVALLEDLAASVVTEIELRSPLRRGEPVASAPPPAAPAPPVARPSGTPLPACSTSPPCRWVSWSPTGDGSGSIPRWPSCSARRSRRSPAARPSCRRIPPTGRPTTRPRGCCWPVSATATRRRSALVGADGEPRLGARHRDRPPRRAGHAAAIPRRPRGHRRPQAGRSRAAQARGALPAGGRGDPGRRVGLGPADRPDHVGRAGARQLRLPAREARRHRGVVVRAAPRRRPRADRERHPRDHRPRRHRMDRRVPLPRRRWALRPRARSRQRSSATRRATPCGWSAA